MLSDTPFHQIAYSTQLRIICTFHHIYACRNSSLVHYAFKRFRPICICFIVLSNFFYCIFRFDIFQNVQMSYASLRIVWSLNCCCYTISEWVYEWVFEFVCGLYGCVSYVSAAVAALFMCGCNLSIIFIFKSDWDFCLQSNMINSHTNTTLNALTNWKEYSNDDRRNQQTNKTKQWISVLLFEFSMWVNKIDKKNTMSHWIPFFAYWQYSSMLNFFEIVCLCIAGISVWECDSLSNINTHKLTTHKKKRLFDRIKIWTSQFCKRHK